MRPRCLAIFVGLPLAFGLASNLRAGPSPVPDLPITGETVNGFLVSWDPDPDSDDFFPSDKAIAAALSLDVSGPANPPAGEPNGTHDGHVRLGFLDPFFTNDWQVNFYDCSVGNDSCDNGFATNGQIAMPADKYKDETDDCIRIILGHELFHHVEFAYQPDGGCGGTWGTTVCEGQARAMQDKIWSDADEDPSLTCKAPFLGDVNNYLGNPGQNLWQSSYRGALWWTYLMEQFGENDEEPTLGADFLVKWWELAGAADPQGNEIAITEDAIQFFAPGRSIGSVFLDFAIANYANKLSFSQVPDEWRERWNYLDDDTPTTSDNFDKPFVFQNAISPGDPWTFNFLGIDTVTVGPWGIQYWEADTSACPAGGVIRLNVTHENGQIGRHGAIASGTSGPFTEVRGVWTSTGPSFNIAFVQSGDLSQRISRLTAVVAGTSSGAEYQFTFSCYEPGGPSNTFAPTPEPIDPTLPPFLVIPAIVDPPVGPLPISGIPPEAIEVFIGSVAEANRAEVVSVAEVAGRYALRVQPPPGSVAPGLQDVLVGVAGTTPTLGGRLLGLAEMTASGVYTFDVSNTIDPAELDLIRRGGSLLAHALRDGNSLGLVRFGFDAAEPNDDAESLWPVLPLDAVTRREVDGILSGTTPLPDAQSSIGDGIATAVTALSNATDSRFIVLVTDGADPGGLTWEDVRADALAAGVRIFAIGLGPDADFAQLQQIALETGGAFYLPDVDDEVLLGMQSAMLDIAQRVTGKPANFNALESIFVSADAGGDRRVKLSDDSSTHQIVTTFDAELGVQFVRGNGAPFPPGTPIVVHEGDGVAVAEIDTSTVAIDFVLLRLTAPVSGDYDVTLTYTGLEAPGPFVDFNLAPREPVAGAPDVIEPEGEVGLAASIVDGLGPIDGADVRVFTVRAQGGDGSTVLFGDGVRGRRPATGGVYTGTYRRTGSYDADEPGLPGVTIYSDLNFNGQDNAGRSFTGRIPRAFFVDTTRASDDPDSDGMPTRYEDLHRCLDPGVDDAGSDPDGDGLDSGSEREIGTLPCQDDTDEGGESDGSEVARGVNPLDGGDDLPLKIPAAYVDDMPSEHEDSLPQLSGTTIHRIPGMARYSNITLKRGVLRDELVPVATFDGANFPDGYPDAGLENGRTYYYQMVISGRGASGTATPVYEGTPYASPYAPLGSVEIDDGAPTTASRQVTLFLSIDNLPTLAGAEVRVGPTPRLGEIAWQPFQAQLPWLLGPDDRQVYAQFREPMGRVSDVYTDTIRVVDPTTVGKLVGRAVAPGGPLTGAGCRLLDEGGVPWAYSAADGSFALGMLAPGVYDLACSRDAYLDGVLEEVAVVAGVTTDVGDVALAPEPDSDGDGLRDGRDNCVNAANGPDAGPNDQLDTDGDAYGNLCDCDFNQDGACDLVDFSNGFLPDFVSQTDSGVGTDMNGDEVVDLEDFQSFLSGFVAGEPGPSGLVP
jgi:hypothetical protein